MFDLLCPPDQTMSWEWKETWAPPAVRVTWDPPIARAACTPPVDTPPPSRGECAVPYHADPYHNVTLGFKPLTPCRLLPRHDGYGQQYPGMPYGMHPSGMYPQQQVRDGPVGAEIEDLIGWNGT